MPQEPIVLPQQPLEIMRQRLQSHRSEEGFRSENLEQNIRWLVTGEGRPVGCPAAGRREDQFLLNLERLRENCYERLSSLHPEDSHISILTALEERVNEGLDHESRMDEVAFNRTLSLHFEEHENDHALIRWLLEAEFLETEDNGVVDAAPNRTITDDLNDGLVSADVLPLHISSDWTAHGRGGPGTMGPAARLLCYWVRGEFLGSCSVSELHLTQEEELLFNLQHDVTSPHYNRQNGSPEFIGHRQLRRRVRLHAVAKVNVFTMIEHDGLFERWVLRDCSPHRYQHQMSETLMPRRESFLICARRGLREELELPDTSRCLESVTATGATRLEWGPGDEGFDSSSMPGLPMLTCINPFEVEFKRDRESAYIELQNTIPTHQFSIDDAGIRTTLNWIPEVNGPNMVESVATIRNGQELNINQWYGINYPRSSFDTTQAKAHLWIEAVVGATLLYHHNTRRLNEELLIDEDNRGILFESRVWTSGVRSTRLGISFFAKSDHDVSALAEQLVQQTIVEPYEDQKYLHYLSSIGRLLQPEIENLPAIDWLTQRIEAARTDTGLEPLDNDGGMRNLLDWERSFHGDNVDTAADIQSNWHRSLRAIFNVLNNPENWPLDGNLSTLLRNQPTFSGPRRIVLFKLFEGGAFETKLRENVNLPVAQHHSDLLARLHGRDDRSILDDETQARMRVTVDELRELNAMVIRLDDQEGGNISSTSADTL